LDSAKHELGLTIHEECDVYFQDEGIFGRMSNPVGCWASSGIRPYLPLQRMRQYDYVYAALCPKTGDLFSLIMPESNIQCMQIFLNEFQAYRGEKKTIMIMDNAGWHTTEKINQIPNLKLAFQPPYSPELNPVEQLWKHIRNNYTHNHFWHSLSQMEEYLCDILAKLSKRPDGIRSFSLFDWMAYY